MTNLLADITGIIGVVLILLAYFLLQRNHIGAHSARYLLMNACGALFILLSLTVQWNLTTFLIEMAWLLISLGGLFRLFKGKFSRKSVD